MAVSGLICRYVSSCLIVGMIFFCCEQLGSWHYFVARLLAIFSVSLLIVSVDKNDVCFLVNDKLAQAGVSPVFDCNKITLLSKGAQCYEQIA